MSAPEQPGAPADDLGLTSEQKADLARVEALEKAIAPPELDEQGNAVVEVPPADPAAENAAILTVIVAMLTPAAPFLAECYTPLVIERIANAYTAVEQKHGWNARAFLSVEAQLAIVALPPTIQAFFLGREFIRQRAIENRLPWWLKWFKRKPAAKQQPLGGDTPMEEGA